MWHNDFQDGCYLMQTRHWVIVGIVAIGGLFILQLTGLAVAERNRQIRDEWFAKAQQDREEMRHDLADIVRTIKQSPIPMR